MSREIQNPPDKFDRWARRMGMKPVFRSSVKIDVDGKTWTSDLLIADSGTTIFVPDDQSPPVESGGHAVYRTGFCILRDGCWVGKWNDYDPGDFALYTLDGAQQVRVQECMNEAEKFLEETARAKLYDAKPHALH